MSASGEKQTLPIEAATSASDPFNDIEPNEFSTVNATLT